ncbi:hypothetical protein [Pseudomonas sp. DP-17]|uniref:hypothetical protein n=1 Tax=Pseudomonas sp. DP-17 TaxID=1580486 RepID=UPI001EFA948E|nr:hypothetical protein [Pseudomonas sp. DP-17]MCG8910328.1 hypothetical protein [Pseudomonas sp. DP-17]
MFKTHESMSVPIMTTFSHEHSYWAMVERDSKTPWFYVTLRFRRDGHFVSRIYMPDTVHLLLQLVDGDTESLFVDELQIVTPAKVNKRGKWLMEPLAKVELALGVDDDEIFIYTTEDGQVYVDPPQSKRFDHAIAQRTMLYSLAEAKKLASVASLPSPKNKGADK